MGPMESVRSDPPTLDGAMATQARPLPAPASLRLVAERVERRLRELLDHETQRWGALDPDLVPPLHALEQLVLGGGKRLRPAFCHWGFIGAGGVDGAPVVTDAGAAFELLQAFALVHDDVMDGSSTRRGARAAHLVFSDRHEVGFWRGEPRRFGEGVAILIGDLAHVYADQFMADANEQAMAIWAELRIELNVGQYLDILGTARGDTELERARRIARYKSGKYTIERPLHVGAALAGAPAATFTALSRYGDPLGEAFQLRDDLLGAFGDSARTGKPVGDDLREGKPTPLLAIAASRATAEQATLLSLVGSPSLSADDITTVQQVLVDTGAVAAIDASIEELTTVAIDAIADAPITEEARRALVELAHYVAWRDR